MFLTTVFTDSDDDDSFASVEEIQEQLDNFLENIQNAYEDSFQDFYFADPSNPIIFHVEWLNGTVSSYNNTFDFNAELFRHITSFDATCNFYLMVQDGSITGCTQWTLVFRVVIATGSYLFHRAPSFQYSYCPNTIVNNDDSPSLGHTNYSLQNIEISSRVVGFKNSTFKFHAKDSQTIPHFKRSNLALYPQLVRYGYLLLFLAVIHLALLIANIINSFLHHRLKLKKDVMYRILDPYEQFHSTIGFWPFVLLFAEIFAVLAGIWFLRDSQAFTQYPRLPTIILFGFSSFFLIAALVRLLQYYPQAYSTALIVRQVFVKLMLIIVSILPIILSLMFVGIFIFSFVSDLSEKFVILCESFLSVTFGDMISDFYASFTDNTELYNILSFIYVTLAVAIVMWLFFTSFTAQVSYIYSDQVSPILLGNMKLDLSDE